MDPAKHNLFSCFINLSSKCKLEIIIEIKTVLTMSDLTLKILHQNFFSYLLTIKKKKKKESYRLNLYLCDEKFQKKTKFDWSFMKILQTWFLLRKKKIPYPNCEWHSDFYIGGNKKKKKITYFWLLVFKTLTTFPPTPTTPRYCKKLDYVGWHSFNFLVFQLLLLLGLFLVFFFNSSSHLPQIR